MKFRDKLIRFFYGRYGNDNLNRFLMILYIIALFASCFFFNIYLYIVPLAIMGVMIFRMMSKNLTKRYAENQRYLKIASGIKAPFKRSFRRFKDRKTHRYRKCPQCKKTLRLPYRKGSHSVICPCCKNKFDVKI